ncbi:hypothetical protein NC652_011910 [Populus alba x Populus x berolinensis]|nr:hypothetical protein NC652_011910 [Populus alba x Populus x berolinensis]
MAIGEIFLAAFLGVLFTRLTSPELLKFARREGIWKKADKWREMILKVQEVLDDAEEKQLTEKAVKIWMDDLRDLAYDVEDLLDEFATESLRRALMAAEEDNRSKIRRIMSTTLSFTKISARAIRFNPKMRSKMKELPPGVPSLEKLVIDECEQLVVSIHSLPKLCKMVINGCKEVVYEGGVYLRSLNSMTISNISKLTCLTEGFIQPLAEVQELEVANCMELASLYENGVALTKQLTSLSKLVVRNCPQVVSLMEGEVPVYMQQQLANCKLESLTLSTCKSLKKLPQWVHSLVSLKELKIRRCPRLLSFPEAGLPSTLRIIEIVGCNALTPLPAAVTYNIMCLEQLHIDNCDSLMSLGRIQLSQTVKKLEIRRCKNLLCLLDDGEGSSSKKSDENTSCSGNNSSLLEYLYVEMCNSLTSIGELPSALKNLQVRSCSKLKSLSSRDKLPAGLKHLAIKGCENLESMPDRFQDNMSLEHISIRSCFNLRSLPEGLHKLCHLREISIGHCPALVSFAAEGLPINLRRLFIMKCDRLKAIPGHMHNLMSLEELSIFNCPGIVSFPEEGFPTSLTFLATIDLKICLYLPWRQEFYRTGKQLTAKTTLIWYKSGFPLVLRLLQLQEASCPYFLCLLFAFFMEFKILLAIMPCQKCRISRI